MTAIVSHSHDTQAEPWLEIVRQKVEAMRFGSVQIVVHEGRVTQVESTEKTRLQESSNHSNGSNLKRR